MKRISWWLNLKTRPTNSPRHTQLKQEYHEMTLEQEAEAVLALTPLEQVEHWELTMLHQRQAETEKEIMGLSQIVKERAKAKAPSRNFIN